MTSFTGRMLGAARLDVRVFEEIEADTGATGQAMAVVVLAGIATAIGNWNLGFTTTLVSLVAGIVGWFIGAGLIYVVGTKLIPGPKTQADLGQLLRVVGFAAAPGLLRVFGILPCMGTLIALATWIWTLAATIVGVHRALDHEGYGRTIAVCLIGWAVWFVVVGVAMVFGAGAALLGGNW